MEKRLLLLLLVLTSADLARAQAPVCFQDAKLKAAVEEALWISDPTAEDMLGLTYLYAGGDDIIYLTGLECATNLQTLELPANRIADVTRLAGLANLQVLSLRSNQIDDVSALSGLSNLRELDLFENQIGDISALAGLSHLQTLNLQRNEVGSVSPLSGLSELSKLDLHRNQVSDVSPLVDLPRLEWLDLRINPLNDDSYAYYIPRMQKNHPGMWLAYYPSMRLRLVLSSTAGGSVVSPGEGQFMWDYGEVVWLQAEAEPGFVFVNWSGSRSELQSSTYLTMDDNYEMRANFLCTRDTLYVNNSTPPADAAESDSHEDGTPEHPFGRIQEAIDVAAERASIIVYPGVYPEQINFLGKSIHLIGMEVNEPQGARWPVIDGGGSDTVVTFGSGEDANSMLVGFTITGGRAQSAGAIQCAASSPTIINCLIVGNRAIDPNGAAILCKDSEATFVNCAITDNYAAGNGAGLYLLNSHAVVVNSIIWADAATGIVTQGDDPYVRYSDIVGGWPGRGNVDTDPLFAKTGYWADASDPGVAVSPTMPDAVWIMGDYHLKSRGGRWNADTGVWVRDRTSSPCIDTGDPRSSVGDEPFPNGGIINMGAYGGTAHACKSYAPILIGRGDETAGALPRLP